MDSTDALGIGLTGFGMKEPGHRRTAPHPLSVHGRRFNLARYFGSNCRSGDHHGLKTVRASTECGCGDAPQRPHLRQTVRGEIISPNPASLLRGTHLFAVVDADAGALVAVCSSNLPSRELVLALRWHDRFPLPLLCYRFPVACRRSSAKTGDAVHRRGGGGLIGDHCDRACGGAEPDAPEDAPTRTLQLRADATIPTGLTPALTSMLEGLSAYISQALQTNQDLLPRNPQSTSQLQAKIAMLQNPSLGADIINGRRWAEGQATSMNGRVIPIVTVFPVESMRNEATEAVHPRHVMPMLEASSTHRSRARIRVW